MLPFMMQTGKLLVMNGLSQGETFSSQVIEVLDLNPESRYSEYQYILKVR